MVRNLDFCKNDIIYLDGVGEITPPNGNFSSLDYFLNIRLDFEWFWWNVNKSKRSTFF